MADEVVVSSPEIEGAEGSHLRQAESEPLGVHERRLQPETVEPVGVSPKKRRRQGGGKGCGTRWVGLT